LLQSVSQSPCDRQSQQVVDWLIALNRAGYDGMHVSFYDFREGLDLPSREVLTLLRDAPTSRARYDGDNSCPASCSWSSPPLVRSAFEKKRRNRPSFLAWIAFGRVPLSPPIPVTGIGDIALDAMQPGMDPCAFGARIILGDVVSGLPFPAQSVPHSPE
jgi:hypothetical protein